MPFQSTINYAQAFGVVGELIKDGPQRATSRVLNSSGTAQTIGYGFTVNAATGVAQVGGTIGAGRIFGGILVHPKEYASYGTAAGGPLAPTLVLPDNAQGELLEMGQIVVYSTTACNEGDQVCYHQTTGAISTVAPGASAGAGTAIVPNAFVQTPTAAAGLIQIKITN